MNSHVHKILHNTSIWCFLLLDNDGQLYCAKLSLSTTDRLIQGDHYAASWN